MAWVWFHQWGSPPYFYRLAGRWATVLGWLALAFGIPGLVLALGFAPPDYQQGEGYRIMFVHVPAGWLSMMSYMVMALAAAVGLIWRMNAAHAVAVSCAPIGASFAALALVTGMIWGKRMWGAWWVWDPRLTSELLLFFLFLGYMGLRGAMEDTGRADRASALLAIIGSVNVPIIHYSVIWWNSLHQGPSVMKLGKPSMPASMLIPLLLMFVAFTLYFYYVLLTRARGELLRRERNAQWMRRVLIPEGGT